MTLLDAFAGPDRIVFGSDAPFPMGVVEPQKTLAMLTEVMGPATDARLRANAISFLKCSCS
jgi:predicted TIM-barrel fold metal-dependent hydrolase